MTFSSLYQLLTDFYRHALGMSIILGLFSACSGDNTDAELAENTKVIDQNFIKSLSYQALYYSNETTNGNLDIEIPIAVYAPNIEAEKVSLDIVKSGAAAPTFSLSNTKEFSPIFDEYGSYDLRLYLESEVTDETGTTIARDTLIKQNAISIVYQDDFSDYSAQEQWSIFPINNNLIATDLISENETASIEKSFSGFDTEKSIQFTLTYRIYHPNIAKGESINGDYKLGVEINNRTFYLSSAVNNQQEIQQLSVYDHGGDFELKLSKYASLLQSSWKLKSASASTTIASETLYVLNDASNVLVGYPEFSYVDEDSPETMTFNFYFEDESLSSSTYTYGTSSEGIVKNGVPMTLTRGPGNYFFKINTTNGIPERYDIVYGALFENNPYQFEVYIEAIELTVP